MNARQKLNRNRRLVQMIFGSQIFSFFSTYRLRIWAYRNWFDIGENFKLMDGVYFTRQHGIEGTLTIGSNVTLGRNITIDYTGNVAIGDHVELSSGAILISHSHDVFNKQSMRTFLKPLHISDGAWIAVNAMIMPGVGSVGKNAVVCTGSVVYKKVPDYAIVRGNPAKVVGYIPHDEEQA